MAWITDYPNPLADEFFAKFPDPDVRPTLGVVA
jgi:hypothetical protein